MTYKPFSIIVVPFPFVDTASAKPRPAFVISTEKFQEKNNHILIGMITTAQNTQWESDIKIKNLENAGLSFSSVCRMKIFTLPLSFIKKEIGNLDEKDKKNVKNQLQKILSI